jgi:hypothetical protein
MPTFAENHYATDCPSQDIYVQQKDTDLQPCLEQFQTRNPDAHLVQGLTTGQPLRSAITNTTKKGPSWENSRLDGQEIPPFHGTRNFVTVSRVPGK